LKSGREKAHFFAFLYLHNEGVSRITIVNRSYERAYERAKDWNGRARPWEDLHAALAAADLVIRPTGAGQTIVASTEFRTIHAARRERPLLMLDLAVPRDFDQAVGDFSEVYLYSVDDLHLACQNNRELRDRELPAAQRIIEQETRRFMGDLYHRTTGPVIRQLRVGWQKPKEDELRRLLNRLPDLAPDAQEEIRQAFDRLVNKLLHTPLESLRDESSQGVPHGLLDALVRLFQLRD
jgi:glutamyl-tRNA reductase